jgi:hypothetical protein
MTQPGASEQSLPEGPDEWEGLASPNPDEAAEERAQARRHPACEWVGIAEDTERVVICGRRAVACIREGDGHPHWACEEHLAELEGKFATSQIRLLPHRPPARPYPEAMS